MADTDSVKDEEKDDKDDIDDGGESGDDNTAEGGGGGGEFAMVASTVMVTESTLFEAGKEEFKEGEEAGLPTIPEGREDEEEVEAPVQVPAKSQEGQEEFAEGEEEEQSGVGSLTSSATRTAEGETTEEGEHKKAHKKGSTDSVKVKEVATTHRYDTHVHQLSGDFGTSQMAEEIFVDEPTSMIYLSEEGDDREEEEQYEGKSEEEGVTKEVTVEELEEEEEYVDREPYYELYRSLMKDYPMLKMKNNFLQRKMAEYFKRRKMEHVLREAERIGDAQAKYNRKLDDLWDLRNTNNMQRSVITTELNEMKELRDKQLKDVVANFEAMQARERAVGTGLIFTKTAKEIPEKFLDRMLKNQSTKSKEIMEMRLCFIKLRNNIEEITAAIRAMDKIGENHTLIDYEQLKMENQNHSDKIEERDEELHRLRTKCAAAIQTLAHLREKSSSTDIDILEMSDKLDEVEMDRNEWREKVNVLKKERDGLRANIVKLQEDSGLLTKPKLLIDMEETLEQIQASKQELNNLRDRYNKKAVALDAIKKNIQEEKETFHPHPHVKDQAPLKPRVWRGKPKLVYPILEQFNIKQYNEDE